VQIKQFFFSGGEKAPDLSAPSSPSFEIFQTPWDIQSEYIDGIRVAILLVRKE
jgi:hypothetical protein